MSASADFQTLGSTAGGGQPWGDINEVIMISNTTTAVREQVEGYLAWKWGTRAVTAPTVTLAPEISPLAIGLAPVLWLDGADTSTLTLSGSNVTQWRDKSGNNNHASTFSGTIAYLSNQLAFTGTQSMTTPLNSVMLSQTMFIVTTPTATGGGEILGVNSTSYLNGVDVQLINYQQRLTRYGGTSIAVGATVTQNTRFLYGVSYVSGGTSFLYLNGTQSGTGTSSATISGSGATVMIAAYRDAGGAQDFYRGTIGEILIYNSVLSTAHRQQVETYLGAKWGLSASLPQPTPALSPFVPLALSQVALWLDAADSSTLTLSGSAVTQWRDKVNGTVFNTQGSSASLTISNAINNLPALYFNNTAGETVSMSGSFAQPSTASVFVVWKSLTQRSGAYRTIIGWNPASAVNPGSFIFGYPGTQTGGTVSIWDNWNGSIVNTRAVVPTTDYIAFASFPSPTFALNGATPTSSSVAFTTTSSPRFVIGGNAFANGETATLFLGEIVIFAIALTTAQRQTVETYLSRKWAVPLPPPPLVLPLVHPYYLRQPILRPFNPLDIDGCSLWLDAADRSMLTLSGSTVTRWRDKSGNGRDGVQYLTFGLPTYSPSYRGRGAVVFSSQVLQTSNNGVPILSVFAVGSGQQAGNWMTSSATGNHGSYYVAFTGGDVNFGLVNTSEALSLAFLTNPVVNTDMMLSGVGILGSTTSAFLNGGTQVATVNTIAAPIKTPLTTFLGGNWFQGNMFLVNATVAEVIAFSVSVTPTQRQQVEAYLAAKWGLRTLTPTTHLARLSPGLSPQFNPLNVGSCALWLDAADPSALLLSGSTITQWRDKSGNGRTATANTPIVYNLNGLGTGCPALTFTNSQWLDGAVSITGTTLTVFSVFSMNIASRGAARVLALGVAGQNDFDNSGRVGILRQGSDAIGPFRNGVYTAARTPYSTPVIHTVFYDGANQHATTGGGALSFNASSGAFAISAYRVGNNTNTADSSAATLDGFIGEIIVFTSALSTIQRQRVEGYLARKWGLLGTLSGPRLTVAPPTPEFSPLGIGTAPSLWLDGADSSTMTISGSGVTQWRDKSPSGNHATSINATHSTLQNNSLVFTGNEQYSTPYSAVLSAETFFIVCRFTSFPADIGLISGTQLNQRIFYISPSESRWTYLGGSAQWGRFISTPMVVDRTYLLGFTWTGTTPTVFRDGDAPSLSSVGGIVGFSGTPIASVFGWGLRGSISELIGFPSVLTTLQRQQVEGYLARKWGILETLTGPGVATTPSFGPVSLGVAPALWLDATDTSTLTLSGSAVTQWRDKSASGHVGTGVASPTLVAASLNGLPSIQFNGSTQYINFGNVVNVGTAQITVFAVSTFDSTATGAIVSKSSARQFPGRWFLIREVGVGGLCFAVEAAASAPTAGFADTSTGPRLLTARWDRSALTIAQNGTQRASVSQVNSSDITGTDPLWVGAYPNGTATGPQPGFFLNGKVGEILVYLGTLTAIQRQRIEDYLAQKWGLASSLPRSTLTLAPTFSPLAVPEVALWLDAADTSTFTLSGTNVTQWRDKSNNARHANALSGSATYNGSVVTFGGSAALNSGLSIGSTTPITVFIVLTSATTSGFRAAISINSYNSSRPNMLALYQSGTNNWWFSGGTAQTDGTTATVAIAANRPYLLALYWSPSFTQIHIDGTTYASSTASPASLIANATMLLGSTTGGGATNLNEFWTGTISEIAVYTRALSVSERQTMESYLTRKWGLASTILPSTHPYRMTPLF